MNPSQARADTLSAAHEALHARLDEAVVDVLVALVEQDGARAQERLGRIAGEISAHARVEETLALPLWERLGLTGARAPAHIVSEHALLERTLAELASALAALPRPADARAIVEVLPLAYRLRGVLEHHSARELLLYPLLDDAAEAPALQAALRATAHASPASAP